MQRRITQVYFWSLMIWFVLIFALPQYKYLATLCFIPIQCANAYVTRNQGMNLSTGLSWILLIVNIITVVFFG